MADDGKTAQIPEAWAQAWKQFYDGIWTDHFSMTGPQFETTDLNPAGYPFCAGKVAMSTNYLWSTYCVDDAGDDWNMAATPAYKAGPRRPPSTPTRGASSSPARTPTRPSRS